MYKFMHTFKLKFIKLKNTSLYDIAVLLFLSFFCISMLSFVFNNIGVHVLYIPQYCFFPPPKGEGGGGGHRNTWTHRKPASQSC